MTSNPSTTSSRGTTTTTTTTSGGGGPCGTCKFLRRKCVASCIFAPYFDSEQGAAHFATVYKVFGASNVSKLLHHVSANKWLDAVVTICYEAQARRRDPVYGCVAHIFALHQQHFCSTTSSTSTTSVTSSTSATSVTSFGSTANVRGSNATDGLMLQTSPTRFQNF